jgi:hypothetical protein
VQIPRILELEAIEEKFRSELPKTGLFGLPANDDGWTETARERLKDPAGVASASAEAATESRLLRGAAFYQNGLSLAQRHLLLEAAMELDAETPTFSPANPPAQEGWLLLFSPERARIRLNANLPAPLAKKISEYVAAKQTLKAELREALKIQTTARNSQRTAALRELAAAQAPRLAALEPLAEEIRRELARLPDLPGPPPAPALPPQLAARITAYRAHKIELLKTLYGMLTGVPPPAAPDPAGAPRTDPAAPDKTAGWLRDGAAQSQLQPGHLKISTAEFNSAQTRLLGELNKEQAGIREALADYFRTTNQPMDRKLINDLLKDFETSRQKQEIWDKYRDYQTAVLMPGLAPEQRRLLFDAAIEQLALPLPAGEKVP